MSGDLLQPGNGCHGGIVVTLNIGKSSNTTRFDAI
jgi:hypothetical protein